MLRLTSTIAHQKDEEKGPSLSQRKFYNEPSPREQRMLETSFDGKNS